MSEIIQQSFQMFPICYFFQVHLVSDWNQVARRVVAAVTSPSVRASSFFTSSLTTFAILSNWWGIIRSKCVRIRLVGIIRRKCLVFSKYRFSWCFLNTPTMKGIIRSMVSMLSFVLAQLRDSKHFAKILRFLPMSQRGHLQQALPENELRLKTTSCLEKILLLKLELKTHCLQSRCQHHLLLVYFEAPNTIFLVQVLRKLHLTLDTGWLLFGCWLRVRTGASFICLSQHPLSLGYRFWGWLSLGSLNFFCLTSSRFFHWSGVLTTCIIIT